MNAISRQIARMSADAILLLMHLGTTPVCSVTLADQLGLDGQQMLEAIHGVRESGICLITCDRETICVARSSWREADARATHYAHLCQHA